MQNSMYTGRATQDPEVRYSQGDNPTAVARLNIASDYFPNGAKEKVTTFIPCVAFGKIAEFIEKYVIKGGEIYMSGYWKNNDYTDREGKKVYGFQYVIEKIELGRKPGSGNAGSQTNNEQQTPPPASEAEGFMNIPDGIDEELPFN